MVLPGYNFKASSFQLIFDRFFGQSSRDSGLFALKNLLDAKQVVVETRKNHYATSNFLDKVGGTVSSLNLPFAAMPCCLSLLLFYPFAVFCYRLFSVLCVDHVALNLLWHVGAAVLLASAPREVI